MSGPLLVLAGDRALEELRAGGLPPERVQVLAGASGGPKWISLYGLDRVLFPWLLSRRAEAGPLHAVGSSIGAWRFACLAGADPLDAIERFRVAYAEEQVYEGRPTAQHVSDVSADILRHLLGPRGVRAIVNHPTVRLHVVTARLRHLANHLGAFGVAGALGVAAALNVVSRRSLSLTVQRVVFDAAGDPGPLAPWEHISTRHVALDEDNAFAALLATASVPFVMAPVPAPAGAPAGRYVDGGVCDYHFGREIEAAEGEGLTLYPHFYPSWSPGYFDHRLPWRRLRHLDRVVLLVPSPAFVAGLPGGRIPDLEDFRALSTRDRLAAWQVALEASERLGDALAEVLQTGRWADVAKPLPFAG